MPFSKPLPTSSSAGISAPLMISSGGVVLSAASVRLPACSRSPLTIARCSVISDAGAAACAAPPAGTSGAAAVFAYASIYVLQPSSRPVSAQYAR